MTNSQPRVTIGVPVYNGERFLAEALEAALAQTFQDFELIISDNASTDRTEAICREYAARDARIRYHRNATNLGATRNYNVLFEMARGSYFKWAAYDDLYSPNFLEQAVAVLEQQPEVMVVYGKSFKLDEQGQNLGYEAVDLHLRQASARERYAAYHRRFKQHRNCNAVFGLIRSNALARTPRIGNYVSSDEVLLAELALMGHMVELPEAFFYRRDHPQMSVRAYKKLSERIAWFDTSKQGQLHLPHWEWLFRQAAAINRVPQPFLGKLACYWELRWWLPRKRRYLYNETIDWVKNALRPLPMPIKQVLRAGLRVGRNLAQAVGLLRPRRSAEERTSSH